MPDNKKTIDIENVIHSKNPGLLRILPGFILNYIKKVLHEKETNQVLYSNRDKYDFDFISSIINDFNIRVVSEGLENIPGSGKISLASNHPLGGFDGLALLQEVGKVRRDLKFLANDILMNLQNIKDLFIPVNKVGKSGLDVFRRIEQAYSENKVVLIFPAGLVSRKQKNGIYDLEWNRSFIKSAVKYQLNIVPCHIKAANSPFFYNLAYWRKKLGIRANLEMFFLVDEMFKLRNKEIRLTFGKPVPFDVFDGTRIEKEWAELFKQHVYSLGEGRKELPLRTI